MAHLESRISVLGTSGLSGKSITGLLVSIAGSFTIIEVKHAAGSQFIKVNQGVLEVGGTEDWDSGTKVVVPSVSA